MVQRTQEPASAYRIDALLAEGFTVHTIRLYIKRGILPHAHGRGPNAYYDTCHIAILRRIKAAREGRCTLDDLREDVRGTYRRHFKAEGA